METASRKTRQKVWRHALRKWFEYLDIKTNLTNLKVNKKLIHGSIMKF